MMSRNQYVSLGLILFLLACEAKVETASEIESMQKDNGWFGSLPEGFPVPRVSLDRAMTSEKIELGRHLFYDPRLSFNESLSCASCHEQKKRLPMAKLALKAQPES